MLKTSKKSRILSLVAFAGVAVASLAASQAFAYGPWTGWAQPNQNNYCTQSGPGELSCQGSSYGQGNALGAFSAPGVPSTKRTQTVGYLSNGTYNYAYDNNINDGTAWTYATGGLTVSLHACSCEGQPIVLW
jgi:hypothetical protein